MDLNVCLLIISILLILLSAVFYYYRSKRLFGKIEQKMEKFIFDYFSRLEYRMATPFKEFEHSGDNTLWLVVFTQNRKQFLLETLESAIKYEPDIKILVVDNGSSDGSRGELVKLLEKKKIARLILNDENIPQWQKCYNIHQAFRLLSVEKCDYIAWIDDDMKISRPFRELGISILDKLKSENVRLVNFIADKVQDDMHKIIRETEVDGVKVKIKASLVGMFVMFDVDLLREIGLPPIREGINELGVEDWYYSRILKQAGYLVAAADIAEHLGYKNSLREAITPLVE